MSQRRAQSVDGGLPGERAPLRHIHWPLQLQRVPFSSISPAMCATSTKKGKAWSLPFLCLWLRRLSFGVLEPLPRTLLSVLLPLFDARVTCQQAFFLQGRTKGLIELHQCTCDGMTQGAGLAGWSTAMYGGFNGVLSHHATDLERELNDLPQGQAWESFLDRLIVDCNVACPPGDPGSGNCALSSSGCILSRYCHATTSPSSLAVITIIE